MLTQQQIDSRPTKSRRKALREDLRFLGRMLNNHVHRTRDRSANPVDGKLALRDKRVQARFDEESR